MIMTFSFLFIAQKDKEFRMQIEKAISNTFDSEIYTDIHKLVFNTKSQTVEIMAKSENSEFSYKIIPKKITYHALQKMLDGNWEDISSDDIIDL